MSANCTNYLEADDTDDDDASRLTSKPVFRYKRHVYFGAYNNNRPYMRDKPMATCHKTTMVIERSTDNTKACRQRIITESRPFLRMNNDIRSYKRSPITL